MPICGIMGAMSSQGDRARNGSIWRRTGAISRSREGELREHLATCDPSKEISGFEGQRLDRADVEWLLTNFDGGRGPVGPSENRVGLNLSRANLSGSDLSDVPLCASRLFESNLKGTNLRRCELHRADLRRALLLEADLREAIMVGTKLRGAHLQYANLQSARLPLANLQFALLNDAQMEGADLKDAVLGGADLRRARFDYRTSLEGILLFSVTTEGPALPTKLADIHWNDVDITAIADWDKCRRLGDDPFRAKSKKTRRDTHSATVLASSRNRLGESDEDQASHLEYAWGDIMYIAVEDLHGPKQRVLEATKEESPDLLEAVRANRQVAALLRDQWRPENAVRFEYRALQLGRRLSRVPPGWIRSNRAASAVHRWVGWSVSFVLDLLCGYGYKPQRTVVSYLVTVGLFAGIYDQYARMHSGFPAEGLHAVWFSMIAFHGRGVISVAIGPNSPLLAVLAMEAFVGLLIEAVLVATLTRRLFRS